MMKTEPFEINVEDAVDKACEYLKNNADCDDLAAILSNMFGCKVEDGEIEGETFKVTPTENYGGGLD